MSIKTGETDGQQEMATWELADSPSRVDYDNALYAMRAAKDKVDEAEELIRREKKR